MRLHPIKTGKDFIDSAMFFFSKQRGRFSTVLLKGELK
jgi:hypothetical protein